MRVALISLKQPADDQPTPRGLLTVAGRSVAMLQLDLALRLGCQRVICLADGLHEHVLPLLHRTEQAGATFHALNGPRALSGLVKAADELFVFAEGVVPDPLAVGETIGERQGILSLPAGAVDNGFERIDRDRAWAGAARMQGSAVERFAEMPGEFEPISALLRIGLQAGVRVIAIPKGQLVDRRWALLRSAADARAFEEDWFQRRASPASFAAPGNAIADRTALRLAPRMLPRRVGRLLPLATGFAALCGGVVAGWAQMPVLAFTSIAVGALLLRGGATLAALARDDRPVGQLTRLIRSFPAIALDAALVAAAALLAPTDALAGWLFAVAVLLAALRLAQASTVPRIAALAGDRILLGVVLAAGAATGHLLAAIQLAALVALVLALVSNRRRELTQA